MPAVELQVLCRQRKQQQTDKEDHGQEKLVGRRVKTRKCALHLDAAQGLRNLQDSKGGAEDK